MPDVTNGPYVAAAVFCDTVIEGTDKMLTCVRIFDRMEVGGRDEAMPTVELPLRGLVSFKSGSFKGPM